MSQWTFSQLEYTRPDLEAVKAKMAQVAQTIREAASAQQVLDGVYALDEYMKPVETNITLVAIRSTLDTTDEFYEKEQEYLDNEMPNVIPFQLACSQAVAQSPWRKEVEAVLGKEFFTNIDLQEKQFCPENIPLMQRESRLTNEYQKIMAGCKISFMGRELNLYGIQKYFEVEDRQVRAAAYRAYSDFYRRNEPRLEEIWDELIQIRNQMGRNLGYENYIPVGYLRQGRTDYGVEEVAAFRQQVLEQIVPLCQTLYRAQAKRLGIDHVMAFDEKRVFPDGNAHPAGDDDFMVAQARKMYHQLSPETGEFIDFMIEHQLMDLKNRPGKAATGYMTSLPDRKAPFVFSCFNQTIFDMQVLTHELGHAFAGYMAMRHQPISDYYSESTDIAEIHSMSMEQFAYPYAEWFFGQDADKFRFAHLQEAITFVPFGAAVDEFQHICYARPELTPKERTWQWHLLEEKYMPWRKYQEDEFMERGGWWYHKLHIYLYPFYYINYTLTTMGAMEFKQKMAQDPQAAWQDYLELCRIGGSMSYRQALEHCHLSIPFEDGAVERAIGFAKQELLAQIQE